MAITGSPQVTGSPEVTTPSNPKLESRAGANTFSSLKSLFKPQYAPQKKCKKCGQMFIPKTP